MSLPFSIRSTRARCALPIALLLHGCVDASRVALPEALLASAPAGSTITLVKHKFQVAPPGAALEEPLVVEVRGPDGALLRGVAVTWTVLDGGGSVAPQKPTTGSDGRARATWTLGEGEEQRVQASARGAGRVLFKARAVAGVRLVTLRGDQQIAPLGSDTLPDPLVVQALDGGGNPVQGLTVFWTVEIGGGGLARVKGETNQHGKVTNRWILDGAIGGQRVRAEVVGAVPILIRATATLEGATLQIVRGHEQIGEPYAPLFEPLVVRVADAEGRPLPGVEVGLEVLSGDGLTPVAAKKTGANGRAATTWALGSKGEQSLRASVAGMPPVTFTAVLIPSGIGRLEPGTRTSCRIQERGRVYCWGLLPGSHLLSYPARLRPELDLVDISLATDHMIAIVGEGRLYGWGHKLLVGKVCEHDHRDVYRCTDHNLWGWPGYEVANVPGVARVHAGDGFTLLLDQSGAGWGYGSNLLGQLGTGPLKYPFWNGDSVDTISVAVSPVRGPSGPFVSMDAAHAHGVGLTPAGEVFAWGANGQGRLGDGTTVTRLLPVRVATDLRFTRISAGGAHNIALTPQGVAYAWGSNTYGQLGDGTTTHRSTPVPVAGGLRFVQVSAANRHSVGLTVDGQVYSWGSNANGRLGDGTTTPRLAPVRAATDLRFVQIGAGHQHTLALTAEGAVYAWGWNYWAQLGDGTTADRHTPNRVLDPQ